MLLDNYTKQSPITGIAGLGGGINSYIFLSSGGDFIISKSLRFNSGDSSFLNRTPSSAGNRKTWTWAGWIKRSSLGARNTLFDSTVGWTGSGDNTYGLLNFEPGDKLGFGFASGGAYTTAVFRDTSAWYHVVAAMDTTQASAADRLKLYVNGVQHTHSGYTIAQNTDYAINTATEHAIGVTKRSNSDRFNGYLADVHFVDGQALAPTDFGEFDTSEVWQPKKFDGKYFTGVSNATGAVPIYNTTDAFGLVKGTGYQSDSFAGTTNGTGLVLAIPGDVATDVHHNINTGSSQASVLNDGVAVVTSNSRLYGSSLQFESGNTDSLTVQNSDMALGTGDFCVEFWVYNKTNKNYNAFISTRDANGASSGFVIASNAAGDLYVYAYGFLTGTVTLPLNQWCHVAYTRASGTHRLFLNGVATTTTTTSRDFTYGTLKIGDNPYATDEPINAEMQDIRVYKGVAKYTSNFRVPARVSNGFHLDFKDTAAIGNDDNGNNNWTANNITAVVPGLATANQGMDVVTYTGNGATGSRALTGLSFKPDFVWLKGRSYSISHLLYDNVRGAGASKSLVSNGTNSEGSASANATFGYLESFDTNGFSIFGGSDVNNGYVNKNSATYVAWAWKAGGAASSNTDGSITASVSANTTYGFSIIKWTGVNNASPQTVGHGLTNQTPKFFLVKNLSTSQNWAVYHASIGNTKYLTLNSTSVAGTSSAYWNDTSPTTTLIHLNNNDAVQRLNNDFVIYAWSEIPGFSKISGYAGSGGAGNKITTGFKPRFVLIKGTDTTHIWQIFDSARNLSNPRNLLLEPNTADPDLTTGNNVNFYDDGFDFNSNSDKINGSGKNYIYAAFASKPDLSELDSLLDSPSQVANQTDSGLGGEITGNYATWNPLNKPSQMTLSNGNLDCQMGSPDSTQLSTIGMSSGKWYAEIKGVSTTGGFYNAIGLGKEGASGYLGSSALGWGYHQDGRKIAGGGAASYGATYAQGDVIGVAFDADNGTLTFYKNGSSQGTAYTGLTSGPYFFAVGSSQTKNVANFGQYAFAYTAPSGYKSLNTASLPTPTIADGSKFFDTKLYTGSGVARSITMDNSEISPDFVWLKARNDAADHHHLFDIVRGAGKRVFSNLTNAESTDNNTLSSFDSNGFSLGTQTAVNGNGDSMVGWAWDAGNGNKTYAITVANPGSGNKYYADGVLGTTLTLAEGSTYKFDQSNNSNSGHPLRFSTTNNGTHGGGSEYTTGVTTSGTPGSAGAYTQIVIAASAPTLYVYCSVHSGMGFQINTNDTGGATNLDGSIASQVRANPSAGFSIVSYTGNGASNATLGHGLGAKPYFYIVKRRDVADQWRVYHQARGATKFLNITNDAEFTGSTIWNNTEPTSSVFSIGSSTSVIASGGTYVAYCFSPVESYSSMGSWTGTGSADGPFLFTGFRPAFVLWKRTNSAAHWSIVDSSRSPSNVADDQLAPNLSGAESANNAAYALDFCSNGFKVRATHEATNASGGIYVYYAVAENPFKSARAR